MLKRTFDLLAAMLGLLLLAPLLLLLALLVKLDTPGPALYRSQRVGRGGRPFAMLKFRSMRHNQGGHAITTAGDARITAVGGWLRRTRLDELPQLLNVLRGEMSLVGPRPEIALYVQRYSPAQRAVLRVRPGITSPAALAFRHEERLLPPGDPDDLYGREIMPAKLALDLDYLARATFWSDLRLIGHTLLLLLIEGGRSLTHLPTARTTQRLAAMLLDAALVAVAVALALELRYSGQVPDVEFERLRLTLLPLIAVFLACNTFAGIYRRLWRYATAADALAIGEATIVATLLVLAVDVIGWTVRPLPVSVALMTGILVLLGSTALRYRWRIFTGVRWRYSAWRRRAAVPGTRVLVVGAGQGGQQIVDYFCAPPQQASYQVVGFVDDDRNKQGMLVHGMSVLGGSDSIPQLVERLGIELVVVALHRPDSARLAALLELCRSTDAQVRVLPSPLDALVTPPTLPTLQQHDLLEREPFSTDARACAELLEGRCVLVTGAAGSIGAELCRQVLAFKPQRLLLLDNNESGLYDLQVELHALGVAPERLRLLIASITDTARLEEIFAAERPALVFHAAAYKHVPLLEDHPQEAISTNLLATRALQELALRYGVERFLFISTDKAVRPSNVMGASKRLGELLMASAPAGQPTRYAAVRFGNVLGSRGSVVPTFARQIDLGGPITITDPRMTRYFMSIPEAVSLVVHAAALMQGGEIFMLDMGARVSIVELAERLIRLRGLRVGTDVPIVFSGIRPGEKLHEELRADHEQPVATPYPGIYRLQSALPVDRGALLAAIDQLATMAASGDIAATRHALFACVAAFDAAQGERLELGAKFEPPRRQACPERSERERQACPEQSEREHF